MCIWLSDAMCGIGMYVLLFNSSVMLFSTKMTPVSTGVIKSSAGVMLFSTSVSLLRPVCYCVVLM